MQIQDLALISEILETYNVPAFVISCLNKNELTEKQREAIQNTILTRKKENNEQMNNQHRIIEILLEAAESKNSNKFISGCKDFFNKNGFLTQKQISCILNTLKQSKQSYYTNYSYSNYKRYNNSYNDTHPIDYDYDQHEFDSVFSW